MTSHVDHGVSTHLHLSCLFNNLFRLKRKNAPQALHLVVLCDGNRFHAMESSWNNSTHYRLVDIYHPFSRIKLYFLVKCLKWSLRESLWSLCILLELGVIMDWDLTSVPHKINRWNSKFDEICLRYSSTHWGRVTHTCVSKPHHHWFR